MLSLSLTPGHPSPLYQQIVDQVCAAVAGGLAVAGDPLPSVRALAEQLVVNPNTVAKAYAQLEEAGVIEGRHGKGFFVSNRRQVFSGKERSRRLDHALERVVSEAGMLGFGEAEIVDALKKAFARAPRAGKDDR